MTRRPPLRLSGLPQCHPRATPEERLKRYTKRDPISGCLIWQGAAHAGGYGRINLHNRVYLAHRFAWTTRNGPIPAGLHVCHRCDERRCVNTEHLFLAAHRINMADRRSKLGKWYGAAPAELNHFLASAKDADLAPIRVLYRGFEFVGRAIARPVDLAIPNPATPPSPTSALHQQKRGSRDGRRARQSRR